MQIVRWLSKGRVLERFWAIEKQIKAFLSEQKSDKTTRFSEFLEDEEKMETVPFLTDNPSHLNQLNVKPQGRDNTTAAVQAFQNTFRLFKNDLRGELVHLPDLLVQTQGNKDDKEINTKI